MPYLCKHAHESLSPSMLYLSPQGCKLKHVQLNIYDTTKFSNTYQQDVFQNIADKSKILTHQFQLTSVNLLSVCVGEGACIRIHRSI